MREGRAALQAREERFRALVENGTDGIALLSADGRVIYVSPSITEILGYTPAELRGQSGFEFIHPEDRKPARALIASSIAQPGVPLPLELRGRDKDGSWRDLELVVVNRLGDPSVAAVVTSFRDITARKRADEARQASEERYRALVEQANDAILVCDAAGRILEANRRAEQLLSRPRALLVGLAYDDLSPEEHANPAHDRERLMVEGALDVQRRQMLRADGSRVSVEVSGALVDVAEGPLAFVTIRDITERTRAEEALRRGAERLKSVLDGALDAVIGMDERGLISSWNPRAEAIFGWTAREAVGRSVADLLIPAGQREAHAKGLERFLATGQGPLIGRRVEVTALHRSGNEFPIELSVVAVEDSGGTAFTAFIADITERRRAQESLEQLRRRYELILNSIADGVHGIDLEGRITFANPAAARMLGWDVAELTERPAHETIHHSWADGAARPKGECPILATVSDAVLRPVQEDVFWRKDGTSFPVEYLAAPKLDADGRGAGAVVTFRDITERKEAERRLTESEAQYRRLFDSNAQPMWVFDEETLAFLAVNAAAILHYGWSHEEFLGLRLTDLRPPEDVPQLLAVLAEARGQNAFFKFGTARALRHRKKDGTFIDVEGVSSRIVFAGRPAWLSLVTDVTERKKLEAQVLQSQKMDSIGRLAGGVAHDFNNILGVITGSGDLLRRRLPEDPRAHKYVDDIQKAADRAAPDPAAPRLQSPTGPAASHRQPQQRHRGDGGDAAPPHRRRRPAGHRLRRSGGARAGRSRPARAGPDEPRCERPRRDATGGAHRDRDGHGVARRGLRVVPCRRGARTPFDARRPRHRPRHVAGGAVPSLRALLHHEGDGEGYGPRPRDRARDREAEWRPFVRRQRARPWIDLQGVPAQHGRAVGKAEVAPVEDAHLTRRSETVLLVEDEAALREILKERLEESGYTVLTAPDGIAALALCEGREGPIDLLLTDVILPRMGGSDLARRLGEIHPGMKVLYMSGYTDDAVILHGVRTEKMPFIQKPFTPSSLVRKIREVLDRRESELEQGRNERVTALGHDHHGGG